MTNEVFVRIDDYEQVLDNVHMLKQKMAQAKSILEHIAQLKHEEDAELESWRHGIDDVEQKIAHIDSSLFIEKTE